MPRVKKVSELPNKPTKEIGNEEMVNMLGMYKENMTFVIAEQKKKKEELDYSIINLTNQYAQLKDEIRRSERDFEQWKRQETQKFENEKNKVMADLNAKLHSVDFGIMEHQKRMQDLEKRELSVVTLEDEKHKLSIDRIEVQNLLNNGKRIIEEGTSKLAYADDKLTKAADLELVNKAEFKRLKNISDEFNKQLEEFNEEKKLFEDTNKNLMELKKVIEPKIAEFKKIQDNIKNEKDIVDNKLKELKEKIAEEKHIMDTLGFEKKSIEERKKELSQREEEFKRKVLIGK